MPVFQTRNWCFTLFHYESVLSTLRELQNNNNIKHCVFQEEICPETQRKHIQGHLCFKEKVTMKYIKNLLCTESIHLEKMKGKPIESYAYCTKDDTHPKDGIREEFGELPTQDKRSDIQRAQELIEEGASFVYKQYIENAL